MPIFRQVTEIEQGVKTETRRVCHPDDELINGVLYHAGRRKWAVGQTYAIVPKRGQAAVQSGRIRIVNIHREQLQQIDHASALLEGVGAVEQYRDLWESINGHTPHRWSHNPAVWVVRFEFVPNEMFIQTAYEVDQHEQR